MAGLTKAEWLDAFTVKFLKNAGGTCKKCGDRVLGGSATCHQCFKDDRNRMNREVWGTRRECLGCRKKIDNRAERCVPCHYAFYGWDPHSKDGSCLDCGAVIRRKNKRCKACHMNAIRPKSTLTLQDAREIRHLLSIGTTGIGMRLAALYGVSNKTISDIKLNKRWKDLTGIPPA